ncbi:MAG: adenylosuccinate synthetase, partial [Candidatus Bathyarchaeia archaeon]
MNLIEDLVKQMREQCSDASASTTSLLEAPHSKASLRSTLMPCNVVVGGFFGDEGKGKIVAYLALKDRPAVVARGGVGPNAGHTLEFDGRVYSLRMVPSVFPSQMS